MTARQFSVKQAQQEAKNTYRRGEVLVNIKLTRKETTMTKFETLLQQNLFSEDPETRQSAAEALEEKYGAEIHGIEMDPTLRFAHHARGCTVIASKIEANVVIYQNVTIGSNQRFNHTTNQWENLGNPVICEHVIVADGAKILGPIIIGANSVIGAGAIITKDVPANSVAFGVNQVKPRDPNYGLVFAEPLLSRDDTIAACQALIKRAAASESQR